MSRIDVTQFVNGIRPSNPQQLTPADLQPFLLYLLVELANTVPALLEARSMTTTDAEAKALDSVERDFENFQARVESYLEFINEAIAQNPGDPKLAQPVVRPLFRGRFPESFKQPDQKTDGLCFDPKRCYSTVPDIANLAIIRNELIEYDLYEEEQQIQLLRDISDNAKELGSEIATAGAGSSVLDFYQQYFEGYVKGYKKSAAYRAKWGLYGAGAALGVVALYKLLK